ncbi:MAG: ribonuclease Z [Bacteroidota bacterium]
MFAVTILGNNSALPVYGRHPTAQVLTINDQLLLIDCGEGTQMQLSRYKVRISKLNYIFISHLHGDHYFGLIGLLTSMGLLSRKNEITIFCPPGLPEIIQLQLNAADIQLPYSINYIIMEQGGILLESRHFTLRCFPVEHRIACWGCRIDENKLPRRVNKAQAVEQGIPAAFFPQLQRGEDYTLPSGSVVRNESVTTSSGKPASYAYCADTRYLPELANLVQGVRLLYHEATYLHEVAEKAYTRFHSTAEQAGMIATAAGVERLLIGHFSSKYEQIEPLLQEASKVFSSTELAIEGVTFLIR